ncbi:hypothetical protein [Bradyrhizobium sp. Tv2a-2]|uniref:hypothetical protein n=1 Tax=Bradyrhizobium sp. Tv2a-2 TaxID=113395 RepID=UPI000405A143|nr:hypothetical protein [Bradyrhizobium sp. Tv2a-2]
MAPHVLIVGADKGGVGKTTVSRTFVDYFETRGITVRSFDTEHPEGVLARFHPTKTKIINLEDPADQMLVFDNLNAAQVTLIDIRAGLLSKTLATLTEVGLLGGAQADRMRTSVVHVIGSNKASFDEIDKTASALAGARHHILLNHINKSKFAGLPDSVRDPIIVGQLNEMAADTVDRLSMGFKAFWNDEANQSGVLRGYVDAWLNRTFKAYDDHAFNVL